MNHWTRPHSRERLQFNLRLTPPQLRASFVGRYLSPRRRIARQGASPGTSTDASEYESAPLYALSVFCPYTRFRICSLCCAEKDIPATLAKLVQHMGQSRQLVEVEIDVIRPDVLVVSKDGRPLTFSRG